MRRYYAFVVTNENKLQIIKTLHTTRILAEAEFIWQFGDTLQMALEVDGSGLRGYLDGKLALEATDADFEAGGIALICQQGRTATQRVRIEPARGSSND
jgi:hypothetical protein